MHIGITQALKMSTHERNLFAFCLAVLPFQIILITGFHLKLPVNLLKLQYSRAIFTGDNDTDQEFG